MKLLRVLIAALLAGSAAISPALAEDAYRYWSYWNADSGEWKYAKLGPAMTKARDGAVDGWRYGVGTVTTSTPPAIAPDFNAVCGGITAETDEVRVAVVIDFGDGDGAPAPRSACAVIAAGLTRASALAAVAPLRLNQGFVCGVDNYPAEGCGESAPAPAATAKQRASAQPSTTPAAVATVTEPASTGTVATSADPVASPASTTQSSEPAADQSSEDSILPTIVTGVLAVVALLLAMRNARIQQEARRK